MTTTHYEPHNARFSDHAHLAARSQVYPLIFGTSRITYQSDTLLRQSERGKVLDGEMGVDRVLMVQPNGFHAPLQFTVQERFRRPRYRSHRDITVTEWNHASGRPSELHKITAGLFVYGYYDARRDTFSDVIAVDTNALLYALARGTVRYNRLRNGKQQSFLTFGFGELYRHGLVVFPPQSHGAKLAVDN